MRAAPRQYPQNPTALRCRVQNCPVRIALFADGGESTLRRRIPPAAAAVATAVEAYPGRYRCGQAETSPADRRRTDPIPKPLVVPKPDRSIRTTGPASAES